MDTNIKTLTQLCGLPPDAFSKYLEETNKKQQEMNQLAEQRIIDAQKQG